MRENFTVKKNDDLMIISFDEDGAHYELKWEAYGPKKANWAWYRRKNGNLHSVDGRPGFENSGGYKCWYEDGLKHREVLPAEIWVNGTKSWYKHGKLHRKDGPARIDPEGPSWFVEMGEHIRTEWRNSEGALHRESGPAVIYADGSREWYVDGKLVRREPATYAEIVARAGAYESIEGGEEASKETHLSAVVALMIAGGLALMKAPKVVEVKKEECVPVA